LTTPPTNFLPRHEPLSPGGAPLSVDQLTSLQQAADAYRQLRKCASVANFSGITTLVLGILGIGCLAFGVNVQGVLAVVVMITIGVVELVGRQRILRGDEGAPKLLAMNQLAFIAAISIYCCVQMATTSVKSSLDELNQAAGGQLDVGGLISKDNAHQMQLAVYGFYGLVMLVSWASQGRLALYYWRRKAIVAAYNAAPEWQRKIILSMHGGLPVSFGFPVSSPPK